MITKWQIKSHIIEYRMTYIRVKYWISKCNTIQSNLCTHYINILIQLPASSVSKQLPHPSGWSLLRNRGPEARLFHILHRMRCTVDACPRSVSITQPAISILHLQIKQTIKSMPLCKTLNSHRKVILVSRHIFIKTCCSIRLC